MQHPQQQQQQRQTTNVTTEQIQKYLDENKNLILAIMENQNLGKLGDCAQYQAQLQKNLMYLAAIADAQPPPQTPPTRSSQPHPHPQQSAAMQGMSMMPGMTQQQQQQTGLFGSSGVPMNIQSNEQQQSTQMQFSQSNMRVGLGTNIHPGHGHGHGSATHLMMDAHGSHPAYGDADANNSSPHVWPNTQS